ncbi:amidohydrolase [Clostridium sp. BJN0001]|uniref:amidohydrolase family protein n=1 Tax=Clostridium sp. BJN0001 TaxID=2930219 RepID=UPI001FD186CA|nr:amidohydrolase [Clostridium sp. BJN0001]
MKIIIAKKIYSEEKILNNYGVVIENGVIEDILSEGEIKKKYSNEEIEYWTDTIMIPGTVNIHNHCFQSLLRGLAVGKPFLEWRDKALYKYSPILTPDDLYTGAVFAFSEMMKCGVTTVSDFFYVHNDGLESDEAIIRAAKDVGIRLVLARTMYDWDGAPKGYVETIDEAVSNTRLLAQKYNNSSDLMTTVLPAPHSLHAASIEMVKKGADLAKELGTKFHIHVAEEPFEVEDIKNKYGVRPVELLEKIGVLNSNMVAVHAVWLDENELNLFCKNKVNLAYCPSSNMFLADGVTNIKKMNSEKVMIGLGSDGACSNNRISVFEEMRMASILQKVDKLDALTIDSKDAFNYGTKNGGLILDLPIGEIKKGMRADFVGINLNDFSMQPMFDNDEQMIPNIVYSMQLTAIKKVVVNGNITVDEGILKTVSSEYVLDRVKKLMVKFQNC